MIHKDTVSDEKLNALLDNELDGQERAQILHIMNTDAQLAERYCELRRVKESVSAAYAHLPIPIQSNKKAQDRRLKPVTMAAASVLLLSLGSVAGWVGGVQMTENNPQMLNNIAQLQTANAYPDRLLIHINSMERHHVQSALDAAKQFLDTDNTTASRKQLEIVANAEGLGILRKGSRYTQTIQDLATNHRNVSFKACGIAKSVAALKEGRDIELLPQAEDIPAALDQILLRIKQGWVYVKG